jgi:tetratricopeptide (TPR) repeat protein
MRLREALASIDPDSAPPAVVAELYQGLGGALLFAGHPQDASEPVDRALRLCQHHELTEPLAWALLYKAILCSFDGRLEESRLNYAGSIEVAKRYGITRVESRAEGSLGDLCMTRDLPEAEHHCQAGLDLARRSGARAMEAFATSNLMYVLTMAGRFDEAYRLGTDLLGSEAAVSQKWNLHFRLATLDALRGDVETARQHLATLDMWASSDDPQDRATRAAAEGDVALTEGEFRLALDASLGAIDECSRAGLEIAHEAMRAAFPNAVDAALALRDFDQADRLVELIAGRPPGEIPPFLRAQVLRARALLEDARGGDNGVEQGLLAAEGEFHVCGYPYWTARAQLDRAEWLTRELRPDESEELAAKSCATFETLGAAPMAARARILLEPDRSVYPNEAPRGSSPARQPT